MMKQTEHDSLYDHRHIIIGEDSFMLLGLVQAMGKDGIRPDVVLSSPDYISESYYIHRSRYIKTFRQVKTPEDALRLIIGLYGIESPTPFLYPLSETEIRLVDEHYDELKDKFYFFNGGGQGALRRWFEKINQCNLARECGFLVPESEIIIKGDLPKEVPYPIFIKATNAVNAGSKSDNGIYHSEDELMAAYKACQGETFLAQQFIDKVDESFFCGVSVNGGQEVYIPLCRNFIRLMDRDFGSYVRYDKITENNLVDGMISFLRKIAYSGVFDFQFIDSRNGLKYFLEVNLRFPADCKCIAYGGADLALIWAQATLDGYLNQKSIKLKDNCFYALDEVRDFDYSVCRGYVSKFKWLHDLLTSDVFFRYEPKDPVPGILFYRDWLWRRFFKSLLWPKFKRGVRKVYHKFYATCIKNG